MHAFYDINMHIDINGGHMLAKVNHWGQSLGIRIPADVSRKLDLKAGCQVEITLEGEEIRIIPMDSKLAKIMMMTREDIYGRLPAAYEQDIIETGPEIGEEVIEWT